MKLRAQIITMEIHTSLPLAKLKQMARELIDADAARPDADYKLHVTQVSGLTVQQPLAEEGEE